MRGGVIDDLANFSARLQTIYKFILLLRERGTNCTTFEKYIEQSSVHLMT